MTIRSMLYCSSLDWYSQNESYINPIIVAPIIITRADLGLPPLDIDWSYRL